MKKFILLLLIITTHTYAGAGSTGGGQSRNGALRDLDGTQEDISCVTGELFLREMVEFNKIVKILKAGNYKFGLDIEIEAKSLSYCLSSSALSETLVGSQNGVYNSENEYNQIAIRVDHSKRNLSQIFIDKAKYKKLNGAHKAFLVLHESMHSYINSDPYVTYYPRLRLFNSEIFDFFKSNTFPTVPEMTALFEKYYVTFTDVDLAFYRTLNGYWVYWEKGNRHYEYRSQELLIELREGLLYQLQNRSETLESATVEVIRKLDDPDRESEPGLARKNNNINIEIYQFLMAAGVDINRLFTYTKFDTDPKEISQESYLYRFVHNSIESNYFTDEELLFENFSLILSQINDLNQTSALKFKKYYDSEGPIVSVKVTPLNRFTWFFENRTKKDENNERNLKLAELFLDTDRVNLESIKIATDKMISIYRKDDTQWSYLRLLQKYNKRNSSKSIITNPIPNFEEDDDEFWE